MRSRVRFPFLPWEFSLVGEDPHSDNGLGSLQNLGLRPLLVLHAHILVYHHSHHRGNVTAPYGRPNLRSRLHFGHNQEGGGHKVYMDMWWHWRGRERERERENFVLYMNIKSNFMLFLFSKKILHRKSCIMLEMYIIKVRKRYLLY
jgi:hypothetical protein